VARRSLDETGLFVLGESHGIAETANAVLALDRQLGVRALGLEWSHDETDEVVQGLFGGGRIDLDALWEIPAGGDLFAGDGRFTAGLVRVLEELVATGGLEQVILFDRLDQDPPLESDREVDMAERILARLRPDAPVLAVSGSFHAGREPFDGAEPMFVQLERALPGLANGVLDFSSGRSYSRDEHDVRRAEARGFDAIFELGRATPAVVPAR
jgi:hypothetical protein